MSDTATATNEAIMRELRAYHAASMELLTEVHELRQAVAALRALEQRVTALEEVRR